MESGVGAGAMLTDLEPGIPGGGTPAATDVRFMGSAPFKNDLLTGREPEKGQGGLR